MGSGPIKFSQPLQVWFSQPDPLYLKKKNYWEEPRRGIGPLVSTAILLSEGYIVETFIQGCIWGPLSTGGHYPRVDLGATIQGWALSKGGSGGHYPRVATIQGWIWGPLSKGGHYPRVATIQGWPLSKGGHYPRVDHGSTIQGWPLLKGWPVSKGWPCCREAKGHLSSVSISSFLIQNCFNLFFGGQRAGRPKAGR